MVQCYSHTKLHIKKHLFSTRICSAIVKSELRSLRQNGVVAGSKFRNLSLASFHLKWMRCWKGTIHRSWRVCDCSLVCAGMTYPADLAPQRRVLSLSLSPLLPWCLSIKPLSFLNNATWMTQQRGGEPACFMVFCQKLRAEPANCVPWASVIICPIIIMTQTTIYYTLRYRWYTRCLDIVKFYLFIFLLLRSVLHCKGVFCNTRVTVRQA